METVKIEFRHLLLSYARLEPLREQCRDQNYGGREGSPLPPTACILTARGWLNITTRGVAYQNLCQKYHVLRNTRHVERVNNFLY